MSTNTLPFTWLFQRSGIRLLPVHSGAHRTFTTIQPSELEDAAEFIQQGSVVLTLGIAFKDRPEELTEYIHHLADAGAHAIGFGTGVPFDTIPDQVISITEERNLTLFEVPREVPFISLVTAAHNEFQRQELAEHKRLFDMQTKLTRVATRGSIEDLLTSASGFLDGALTLEDSDGRTIATTAALADATPASPLRTSKSRSATPNASSTDATTPARHRSRYKMTSHGDRFHELVLHHDSPMTSQQRSLLRHLAGLCDMLLFRPVELHESRNELNRLAMTVHLGLDRSHDILPRIFSDASDNDGFVTPSIIHTDDKRSLTRAIAAVDAHLSTSSLCFFALPLSDQSTLILSPGGARQEHIVASLGPHLRTARIAQGSPITWTKLTLDHVHALEDRARTLPLGTVATPQDLPLTWLNNPDVTTALAARHTEVFDRLVDHDARTGSDLKRTLIIYLRHNCHIAAAATTLGVHRHTVRNRIERIQELCQLDLGDPITGAELLLATLTSNVETSLHRHANRSSSH